MKPIPKLMNVENCLKSYKFSVFKKEKYIGKMQEISVFIKKID